MSLEEKRCVYGDFFSLRGLLLASPLWLSLFSTLMGLNFPPFFFCGGSTSGFLWKSDEEENETANCFTFLNVRKISTK